MKYSFLATITLFVCCLCACKKQEPKPEVLSECLQAKIEAFKLLPRAHSIVKILKPDRPLYWFVDDYVDGGEEVVDADCTLICTADCECGPPIVLCNGSDLNFPLETIWQK